MQIATLKVKANLFKSDHTYLVYMCLKFQKFCVMRTSVFGVSYHVRHKPGCTVTDAKLLKVSDFLRRWIVLFMKTGTDKLCGYCAADLQLNSFSHVQKAGFPMTGLIMFLFTVLPTCLPPFYNTYYASTTEQNITSPNYPGDYNK